jgi:nitrate/TMAO reductase-like tetraheme cytochrome c subunit
MKNLILGFIFVLGAFWGNTQTTTNQTSSPTFFAQCMVNLNDPNDLTTLENQLRSIPYVSVVRVDIPTHRLFLITKNISTFTSTEFVSWMGTYSSSYSCLQIGLHGVDPVNPYPFTNCSEN